MPATPWVKEKIPDRPQLEWAAADRHTLTVRPADDGVRLYVVRHQAAGRWAVRLVPAEGKRPVAVSFEEAPARVAVSAIGRAGTESEMALVAK